MPNYLAANRLLGTALLAAVACAPVTPQSGAVAPVLPGQPHDPHSFARPEQARVTNVSLDLTPDFSTHRIAGTARLSIQKVAGADSIILDVRDLDIRRVTDQSGAPLGYRVGAAQQFVGAPLAIAIRPTTDAIIIDYATSPNAAAVQWLSPEQTAGKRLPFLFTQGESILTRTWVPTQDSPGIRQTYDATLHVPPGMRAVTSPSGR
jgi:aminopeptidase N